LLVPKSIASLKKRDCGAETTISNYQLQITNVFVLLTAMELRKDPITRSWVITGDDVTESKPRSQECPFCGPSAQPTQVIANLPGVHGIA